VGTEKKKKKKRKGGKMKKKKKNQAQNAGADGKLKRPVKIRLIGAVRSKSRKKKKPRNQSGKEPHTGEKREKVSEFKKARGQEKGEGKY